MAFTFTPYKNGWEHSRVLDSQLTLRAAGTAITTDTTGTAVTAGFEKGHILALLVDVDSADYTTGDEEYFFWIQRYDGDATSPGWKDIQGACIKLATTGASPDAIDTGLYSAQFKVPKDATQLRYRVDVEGTSPSVDPSIYIGIAP
jgi:hypothetical protein